MSTNKTPHPAADLLRAIADGEQMPTRQDWAAAFEEARDAVLHCRGPLEDAGLDNDQVNAVLSVLDDSFAFAFEPTAPKPSMQIPEVAQPDADGWISWTGGECPVDATTRLDVRCRNGDGERGTLAWMFSWSHEDEGDDIVAYRVAEDAK